MAAGAPASDSGFSVALISIRAVHVAPYQMRLDAFSADTRFQAAVILNADAAADDDASSSITPSVPLSLPVLRIFGTTPAGQNACLHIHRLRPYLYVPLPSSTPANAAVAFAAALRTALEVAVASSLAAERSADAPRAGAETRPRFIDAIEPELRTSIYGYRPEPSVFLKISVYDPSVVRRLAALFERGGDALGLAGLAFQSYESNFNFTLQALTDLNLVGMGYVNLRTCKFRHVPDGAEGASLSQGAFEKVFTTASVSSHDGGLMWPFGAVERHAKCDVELDAYVEDVLNPCGGGEADAGQQSGPAGYAAQTLQALWDEERIRIGGKVPVPTEAPRNCVAGPELSGPRLRERLRELLEEGRNGGDVLDDVVEFLDAEFEDAGVDGETSAAKVVGGAELELEEDKVVEAWSDGSRDDHLRDDRSSDGDDDDEWESIRECTQVPVQGGGEVIPQGDGSGDFDPSDDDSPYEGLDVGEESERLKRPRRLARASSSAAEFGGDAPLNHGGPGGRSTDVSILPAGQDALRSPLRECSRGAPDPSAVVSRPGQPLERPPMPRKRRRVSFHAPSMPLEGSGERGEVLDLSVGDVFANDSPFKFGESASGVAETAVARSAKCAPFLALSKLPPSSAAVCGEFGLEKAETSILRVPVFYGNPEDATEISHAPSAYARRHIPAGGVAGLVKVKNRFGDESVSVPTQKCMVLASVRGPPSYSSVCVDAAQAEDALSLGRCGAGRFGAGRVAGGKSKIDSVGRLVGGGPGGQQDFENTISAETASFGGPQPVRRVIRAVRKPSSQNDSSDSDSLNGTVLSTVYEKTLAMRASRASRATVGGIDSPVFGISSKAQEKIAGSTVSPASRKITPASFECSAVNPHRHQSLGICVVDVIASCRRHHLPDPSCDSVLAVCLWLRDERKPNGEGRNACKVFLVGDRGTVPEGVEMNCFEKEDSLMIALSAEIELFDPDILTGFETQTESIGYLLERADALGMQEFVKKLSRVKSARHTGRGLFRRRPEETGEKSASAKYFQRKGADVNIVGRHVLNIWRLVRKEVKLASYTLEAIALEVLGITLSKHTSHILAQVWLSSKFRNRAIRHLCLRTEVCMLMLDKLDIIGRTGELARVYGIDFWSVLTRGSQYWVESMLARVAHPRGFILLAASRDQVKSMPAVECIPLVMEPESSFFADPVVVLDFQSLYPSVIIAHNLCFSTMLGNVNSISSWTSAQNIGVIKDFHAPSADELKSHFGCTMPQDGIFVAPNGHMFVTASHRRGVLPQMLSEILETRIMVKGAMKDVRAQSGGDVDEDLLKRLNARQFACKLLANVTYGFAGASMSGRMPCSGLADSIVQCGRNALERIVDHVKAELSETARAEVVYGDTDSLFVRVAGATKAEAFEIGRRICAKAEEMFPSPMKLQLEKVYFPCFLVAKKRYVGYAYETEDSVAPIFDDKGIETVRRDSCALTQKTLERSIRLFFEGGDLSRVKRFFQRTCQRIQRNKLPLSEFMFRKEVKGNESYAKDRPVPPARQVANAAVALDSRAEPRHGERVAFVVVYGNPGAALKDCVVSPSVFLDDEKDGKSRINATYYITRHLIKPLERIFNLTGGRVSAWFAEVPRFAFPSGGARSRNIPSLFDTLKCLVCQEWHDSPVCSTCRRGDGAIQFSLYFALMRQRKWDSRLSSLNRICLSCIGGAEQSIENVSCVSLDCPVRFQRISTGLQAEHLRKALSNPELWLPL